MVGDFEADEERGLMLPSSIKRQEERREDSYQRQIQELREEVTLAQRELEDLSSRRISDMGRGSGDVYESQRISIFKRAREAFRRDPNISRAVRFIAEFTFGRGVTYRAANPVVQECIDKFWEDSYNHAELTGAKAQLDRAAELVIAGEIFLVFYDGQETTSVRSFNPEEITEIIPSPDDYRAVRWYRRSTWQQKYDYRNGTWGVGQEKIEYYPDWKYTGWEQDTDVPDDKLGKGLVYHMAVETLFGARRGISYLAQALDWARVYREFLEDRVSLNRSLATFAWKRKVMGGPGDVQGTGLQRKLVGSGYAPGGVGQVYTSNQAADLEPITTNSGGANARDDGYQLKLQLCAATGIMNHYFGDASQSNLATARSMELPQVREFDTWQQKWSDAFKDIALLVIERALVRGKVRLEGVTYDPNRGLQVKDRELLYVDVDFPVISWLDVLNYVQAIEASNLTTIQKLRLELVAFGFNNVDNEIQAWKNYQEENKSTQDIQEAAKYTLAWVARRYKDLGKDIADWGSDAVQDHLKELEKAAA